MEEPLTPPAILAGEDCLKAALIPCEDGHHIGHLRLDAPKRLNSLNLSTIRSLYHHLMLWKQDSEVVALVLDSSSPKAFCAGGDVQALYQSACAIAEAPQDALGFHKAPYACEPEAERCASAVKASVLEAAHFAQAFFTEEYRLDALIHNYAKPIVCLGNGIVMGGGMGLMNGCSHRVVSDRSRLAMPEISIGLFPDVGATWFLAQMPAGAARFLGLTGSHCNAADALNVGWADHFIPASEIDEILPALTKLSWSSNESNHSRITALLKGLSETHIRQLPQPLLEPMESLLGALSRSPSFEDLLTQLRNTAQEDTAAGKACRNMESGSVVSAHLIGWQLFNGTNFSLAEALRSELVMALNCLCFPDFREGVRARLIDKDQRPNWQFDGSEPLPARLIDTFHRPPWPSNPLNDL